MLNTAEKLWNMIAWTSKPASASSEAYVFFQIKPFKDNDRWVAHWDTIIKNLVSLKTKKIIFVMRGNSTNIKYFVALPKEFQQYFQSTFYSNYPTSDLAQVADPQFAIQKEYIKFSKTATLKTKEEFTKDGTYMDPLSTLMALFTNLDAKSNLDIYFTYTFKRDKSLWDHVLAFLKRVRTIRKKSEEGEEIKPLVEVKNDLFCSLAYKITSNDSHIIEGAKINIKAAFSPFASDGKIEVSKKETFIPMIYGQAVNFFHIPLMENFYKGMEYTLYRKLPYPTNLPISKGNFDKELTVLGNTDYRGEKIEFGIKREDKFRHMYIVGKTGTGKSTFIANLIKNDMLAGNGLALLDPHGELVDTVLEHIPTNRINDVILFDVSDSDFPIGFNLLQANTEDEKNLVASGVVSTFYKIYGESRGPRLEYILRNVVLSLVDYPNATLMHILRMLTDKNFREEVISHIKDSVILKFWQVEFNKRNDKQRDEAISPITNKVGQFLSAKLVRNIFGQPRTKLNLRKAMDEGKIILINLSKGKIGEDNAKMIGSLLVTKFQIDAMSRADMAAHLRKDFYLYIDEFQNFASKSFATILSEARKYKLSLIVANQYTSQLDEDTKNAIFGNVGTTIAFTLGKDDADIITGQFKNMAEVNDLISLPKYTAYTRLMIDGISSDPFSMKTLPISTPEWSLELIDKIRKQSRQRYAMERNQLEGLMVAWNNKTFSLQEKVSEKAKLEAMGISEQEAENCQDMFVQQHMHYFTEFSIDGVEPDYIIFDINNSGHKAIWIAKPKWIDDQANLKIKKWGDVPLKNGSIKSHIDIYQHQTITIENNGSLMMWIGSKEEIYKQLEDIYTSAAIPKEKQNFLKVVPNIKKLESLLPVEKTGGNPVDKETPTNTNTTPIEKKEVWSQKTEPTPPTSTFSIKDIKLGERYEWYVKLSYNYGMFVTVKGVEWLLHKNFIVAPEGVERKKFYNIGDKIKVKAMEFKEVNGEQKVVWWQKK